MTETELLANILFAETKDTDDAIAIANVIKNRLAKPKRFGDTLEKVVYAPYQFSGVNTPEWNKAVNRQFTPEEKRIYNNFQNIARGVMIGTIQDTTGGADHYYNPEISNPDWGKLYPETYKTQGHRYLKEVPVKKKK